MTKWQRRARLLVAVFAVGFAVMLAVAFRHRVPVTPSIATGRTDPNSIVESTTGQTVRFNRAHEDVTVGYDKTTTYKDGVTRLEGVKIVSAARNGSRTFTVTAKEGVVGQNESAFTMNGAVTMMASDGLIAHTEHATYTEGDGMLRAPGPVEFSRTRLSGSGVGMTYDKNQDVLVILEQAHVRIAADKKESATEVTSPTATVARRDKVVRFERGLTSARDGQIVQADSGVAHLSSDEERIESVELRGNSRISGSKVAPGGLQSLTGHDMDLKYAADGETLEHALIVGEAVLQIAGQKGSPGRQIASNMLDMTLAPDGTTPVALLGRDAVQLTFPAEPGAAARTIKAASLDARGDARKGLTFAQFTGEVDFREKGSGANRAAKAGRLDLTLKPGMSSIEEAKFFENARFCVFAAAAAGSACDEKVATEMLASAAVARYVLEKGTLDLGGSEPGAPRPHVANDHIAVDAARIDVVLAGPKLTARGEVASVLQPPKKDSKSTETKMPSMLKGDQPLKVIASDLDYDGTLSKASYTGKVTMFQPERSIQADAVEIDNKTGNLLASGSAVTSTMLVQGDKTKVPRDRVRSIGKAQTFKYEESLRQATYTGEAHLSGPQGDMIADKIELFLKPTGDEIDRAEAYDNLTLREQNRKTTGQRLTYTTSNDTYVVTGAPVTIVDQCGGESVGQKLTFVKATDTVNLDGGGQVRTQTKGNGKCS
jgi:LPS export ABC transporter protein LptC/lipopolysaccharide transport protein LptA